MQLLLEGIYQHYGYDFRGYAAASLKRRLWRRAHAEGLTTLSGLQDRVLHDPGCMERLLHDLSINVTSMFRDPTFYAAFRDHVVPAAAHLSVPADLERGLLDRRGDLLAGDPADGGGPLRQDADLRDRHQRRRDRARPRRALPARADARLHRQLPARRRPGGVLALLHGRRRGGELQPGHLQPRRVREPQPGLRRPVQRVQRHRLPQRHDLLRQGLAGPRARSLLRVARDVRRAGARPQGVDSLHARTSTRSRNSNTRERLYRKIR